MALEFSIDEVSDFVWRCLACLLGLFVFAGTDLAHPFRNIRMFFLFSFGLLAWQKNPSQAVAGQRRSPSDRKDMRYEKIKVRPIQNRSPFLFIEFVKARVRIMARLSENSFILFLMWPEIPEHLHHGAGANWNVPIPDRPRL